MKYVFVLLTFLLFSCLNKHENSDSGNECSFCDSVKNISNFNVELIGFTNDVIDSISMITVYKQGDSDSSKIPCSLHSNGRYVCRINDTLSIENKFYFIINKTSYQINDMKLKCKILGTMTGPSGYDCKLGQYYLDNKRFDYDYIRIVK